MAASRKTHHTAAGADVSSAGAEGPPPPPAPLICGLPDEVATLCLARVPFIYQGTMKAVSRSWRALISGPEFQALRRAASLADEWLVVVSRGGQIKFRKEGHGGELTVADTDVLQLLVFDVHRRTWLRTSKPMPEEVRGKCRGFGTAVVQGQVYVFGGEAKRGPPGASMWKWDPRTNQWSRAASMRTPRSFMASGIVGNRLYVAGGVGHRRKLLDSSEVYDADTDQWEAVAPAQRDPRSSPSCQALVIDRKTYAVDGVWCTALSQGLYLEVSPG